jgi:FK506-binding nuclear protein
MVVALAVWSIALEGGEEKPVELPTHVQITNISFGENLADKTGRTVVKLTYSLPHTSDDDDEDEDEDEGALSRITTVLCALTPGKIEQSSVNLTLDPESQPTFQATGKNTVYLTGNYIEQSPENDLSPFGSEIGTDDEDDFDLRDVSSDVEMHPDELADVDSDASRFEEVKDEEPKKTQKRPRESDVADASTKSDKKSKKLKAEDGKAISVDTDKKKEGGEKEGAKEEGGKKEKKKDKKEKKKAANAEGESTVLNKQTIAGGVIVEDAKIGSGPMAKKGNTVQMRYIGKLTDGKEFDKNTKGKPFTFHLGKGQVIKGWDEGIVGMQVGGERKLTIPANMAYGKKGHSGIPANATLVFEVKLLEIK